MQRYTPYRTDLRRREEEERTVIMGEALNSNGPQTKCTRDIEVRQPDRPWSNDRKMLRPFYEILASINDRRKRACVRSHLVFHRNDEPPTRRSNESKLEKGFLEILAPSPISYELGLFYYYFRNVKNSFYPSSSFSLKSILARFMSRGRDFRGKNVISSKDIFVLFLRNYRNFLNDYTRSLMIK